MTDDIEDIFRKFDEIFCEPSKELRIREQWYFSLD